MAVAHDALLEWRSEFPLAQHATHLIAHSLGAMPRRVRTKLARYLDQWDGRGIRSWISGVTADRRSRSTR